MSENISGQLVTTKQHFEVLDGMRGIAAISVVIYHFMEFVVPDYNDSFIAHGHLAVDFFFCLSGFVIAYAYDSRIKALGFFAFIKLRLIRLQPLVILGAVLGLLSFLFDPFSDLQAAYPLAQKAIMFASSCLLIPYASVPERYNNFFYLNPPTWSLFWEYVANVLYAVLLFRLKNKILWVLTGIAAVLLCFESSRSGYLGVGWGGGNFWGGGIRILFSFLAGMLMFRMGWKIKSRIGLAGMGTLLLLAFLIPFSKSSNFLIDPLVVIIYFPFLVILGAGAELSPAFRNACKFLGDISYPLYMIHYPFLWIFLSYLGSAKPSMPAMAAVSVIGTILLVIIAYMVLMFYDEPIRKFLKTRFIKKADRFVESSLVEAKTES